MRDSSTTWQKAAPFAALSLVGFLCGVGLLALMLWKVEWLVAFGLVDRFYYIVLLPLGLAWATFLFGVFRSYARYTGKVLGGTLELGGPIVGALLIVVGGFYLPKPDPDAFAITVFVHGENGLHDLVLRNTGTVWMTLGSDRRAEKIGDKGEADFKNIPSSFRGREVPVSVEAEEFESANPSQQYCLSGTSIYVEVRHKLKRLTGRVQDTNGRLVSNAVVRVGELQTNVDAAGRFSFLLPGGSPPGGIEGEVSAPGFETWRGRFFPNAGDAAIMLRRIP